MLDNENEFLALLKLEVIDFVKKCLRENICNKGSSLQQQGHSRGVQDGSVQVL